MNTFFLRVTLKDTTQSDFLSFVVGNTDHYIYCFEGIGTGNPHAHVLFQSLTTQKTMGAQLRAIGASKHYAFTKCEQGWPLATIAYLFKQNNWYSEGIPTEVMDKAKAYDDIIKQEVNDRKLAKQNLLKTLTKECIDSRAIRDEFFDDAKVQTIILLYYKKHNLTVRRFYLKSLFDTMKLNAIDPVNDPLRFTQYRQELFGESLKLF